MVLMSPLLIAYGLLLLAVFGLWVMSRRVSRAARDWREGLQTVEGFVLHPRLHYHAGHTWVMPKGNGTVRVGIDDFGRRIIEGIRGIRLPAKGSKVVEGEVAVHLDCGPRHAKLLSPVDGIVVEVNETLSQGGALPDDVERDPYGKGWLFTVQVPDRRFMRLPTSLTAKDWLKSEADRLSRLVHEDLGVVAADGGEMISKPSATLDEEQWQALTRTFFHAA